MKYFIGIDPGSANGGIAVVDENGALLDAVKMFDTATDIYEYMQRWSPSELSHIQQYKVVAVLERVHGLPGMAGSAMFSFGENFGFIQMALLNNHIPFETHTPQKWMKYYQLKRAKTESKTEWKNRLKGVAQQLYPAAKITLATSDAILIAHYAYRTMK